MWEPADTPGRLSPQVPAPPPPGTYAAVERWHFVHRSAVACYLFVDGHCAAMRPAETQAPYNLWADGAPAGAYGYLTTVQDWYTQYQYGW